MKKALITGGAGFIGHHVVEYLMKHTGWDLTLIDRLDGAGNYNRLAEIGLPKDQVRVFYHDLRAPITGQVAAQLGKFDYIIHLAAATHVDRSIENPMEFVYNNVVATCSILDFARLSGCERFLQFSTDEVFGPAPVGRSYLEDDRYRSGNPYAATKAGAEELAVAYHNTYGLPVVVTHTMNVIGERQHPEKFLPMTVSKVLKGQTVLIHSDRERRNPGSRFYIHARDVASAVHLLLRHGKPGEKYNVVGEQEVNNLNLARIVANALDRRLKFELVDFHSSRPGHDLRYAMNGEKLRSMGWSVSRRIENVITEVARWTADNRRWLVESIGEAA